MRKIGLIILTLLLINSCIDNSKNNNKSQTVISVSEITTEDSLNKTIAQPDNNESISNSELLDVYAKAVQYFPNDSASIYRFYFKCK